MLSPCGKKWYIHIFLRLAHRTVAWSSRHIRVKLGARDEVIAAFLMISEVGNEGSGETFLICFLFASQMSRKQEEESFLKHK